MKEDELSPTPEGPLHPPSPFLIVANKLLGGPVILNVGGKRHEVRAGQGGMVGWMMEVVVR